MLLRSLASKVGRCRWRWRPRSRALAIVREGITTGDAPPRAETSSRTTEGTGAHKWQLPDVERLCSLAVPSSAAGSGAGGSCGGDSGRDDDAGGEVATHR